MQLVQFTRCAFLGLLVSCRRYDEKVDHIDNDRLNIRNCIAQVDTRQFLSRGEFPVWLCVMFKSSGCSLSNRAYNLAGD